MDNRHNESSIEEALCEFLFVPELPFDMTTLGLFYEKVKDKFPQKHFQMNFKTDFQIRISSEAEKGEGKGNFDIKQFMQFFKLISLH